MRHNWLRKCLDSIQASTLPVHIIVVDNASTDETTAIIKMEYPSVELIEAKENLGFGKANNVGLESALHQGFEFFFLLNQDAWTEPDTIEHLTKQLEKNPEYGILSPLHLTGNGEKLDFHFISSASYSKCPNLCSDFILNLNTDKVYETENVCAASWMLNKRCLELVGGFSPSFFHYAEDNNYINRLHFKKLKIGIYPKVKIYHDREERPINKSFSNREFDTRNWYLLNISNPCENYNVINAIHSLKKDKFINALKRNNEDLKINKNLILYFKENRKKLEYNLFISKNKKFAFLNYTE